MKKTYEEPMIEVLEFDVEDVITASSTPGFAPGSPFEDWTPIG